MGTDDYIIRMTIFQFAPIDTPAAVERFLEHWNPQAAVIMESELWPTIILASATKGVSFWFILLILVLVSVQRNMRASLTILEMQYL